MPPSRTASRLSSAYFQPGQSSTGSFDSSVPGVFNIPDLQNDDGIRSQYATSVSTGRPSTSRPSTTRPSTASGRKSRATTASSILGLTDSQSIICAVSEARGVAPSVGVAVVNIAIGEVILSQICDNQSYVKTIHKIQMSGPSRIIFMSSACPPNKPSVLFSLTQELIPEAQIQALDRSAWSESNGLDYIHNLAFRDDIEALQVALSGKYYAISSFSAVMKYIENHFTISFVPHSLRVRYQPSEDTMMIDISAIQSLELMHNLRSSKSKECLFGLLNHTCTPMGARMLSSNILQPPTQPDSFIIPRYDALEELITNEEMFREIRKALKLFHDAEKLFTKLITVKTSADIQHAEDQINQVLMIKSFLESIPELHRALSAAKSPLMVKIRELCRPEITSQMLCTIRRVIEADVTYHKSPLDLRNQRTFAVKSGISGILDVARQTYKELTEEIHQHVDELNAEHHLNATLKFDNGRKYWLRLKSIDFDGQELPDVLINVVRKKGCFECQTLDLVKLNVRMSDTCNDVVIHSDSVIQDLLKNLRLEASHLFRVCESIALIDMISSFAQLATTQDYVRPEIGGALALKCARHPILDKMMADSFVPNDYFATEQYSFHAVTGCNMSGKSTYIRAIALLQIMAQIGSFVPAEYASFTIRHAIFARVSMEDSIENNLSTFSVEMREMAFILRNVNHKSLAIIDELGRGTSTTDGLAISCAMSEALIQSKASVWFATHFTELAHVLTDRPGVLNLHLASHSSVARNGVPQITMLYKATSGELDDKEFYGINLARIVGLPQRFIDKAEEVAQDLRRKKEANRQSAESKRLMARRQLILGLHDALKLARDSGNEDSLAAYLPKLQGDFIMRMDEVDSM